jgi:hypothetical protein
MIFFDDMRNLIETFRSIGARACLVYHRKGLQISHLIPMDLISRHEVFGYRLPHAI